MIDTHAHLYLSEVPLEQLVQRAKDAGLTHIINIGINVDTSQQAIDSYKEYPDFIKATVGIHPGETQDASRLSEIEALAKEDGVVALGEMGLDYFKLYAPKDVQLQCFEAQLDLADRLKLPIVIHNRESNEDISRLTKQYPKVKKVFHCFSGAPALVDELMADDHYFSFTGHITYAKKGKTVNAIKHLPLNKIMIETDSPYLTPKAHQGKRNEPAFVVDVLDKIAQIKEISVDDASSAILNTSRSFFNVGDSLT